MRTYTASRTAKLVVAFDSSGIHRIGTPGDFASGEWLSAEASIAGALVSRMTVAVNHTIVDDAYLVSGDLRVDGFPMFDSPPTLDKGVSGSLVLNEHVGDIGYLDLPPNSASIKNMRFEKIRRATSHSALVVSTRVTGESLAPINAQYYEEPFGPPVLLVAGANHELLNARAQDCLPITVVSRHHRKLSASYNVEAIISSDIDTAPALYIVTPRTGWWESVAERAGGLVAWLAGVEAAVHMRSQNILKCPVRAYATCGHELGHLGLAELLKLDKSITHSDKPILHLGANLGCASNTALFLRAADIKQALLMRELLLVEGYPDKSIHVESIDVVSGEGYDLAKHGAKVLSMAGANSHFHAASDRWPGNVSSEGISAIARAVAKWVTLTASK